MIINKTFLFYSLWLYRLFTSILGFYLYCRSLFSTIFIIWFCNNWLFSIVLIQYTLLLLLICNLTFIIYLNLIYNLTWLIIFLNIIFFSLNLFLLIFLLLLIFFHIKILYFFSLFIVRYDIRLIGWSKFLSNFWLN